MSTSLTFLFTDLEDSTRLWEQHPEAMRPAAARHDALLKEVVARYGGRVVKSTGDGLHGAFESAADGVAAALAAQRALAAESWPEDTGPLKVRMGLHTGESEEREGDYYGPEVNFAARVMDLGYGGQVLLSEVTAVLARNALPQGSTLEDLGEHRIKGIAAPGRIFQLCHPSLPVAFPPLRSLAAYKHNLRRQLSSFIGRERELAEIRRLLASTRLLTLLGPGGTGKTRLMLQAGEEVIENYADGVWLVELAPLTDPERIAARIAASLNVQEQPGREVLETLAAYLRRKELLLLLDNVEHVVRESAVIVEQLLERCRDLSILVTGREALFIGGETTLQIPSLSLPGRNGARSPEEVRGSEAVQLFLERARAVRPAFEVTAQNADAVVEVVQRLDGIPLALELAAARLRMLTVEQIAARLNDRFRLLTGGRRTALPRQQTLQALIDWSWNLLSEEECILLRRLSVFAGGWTVEAAQAVTGYEPLDEFDVFDHLETLINKSLVTVSYPLDGEARYGMLESIRQYARDRLFEAGEGEALRDRHADYFVALAQEAGPRLDGPAMMVWVGRLRQELDNFRAVMDWTLEDRPEMALRLTGMLRYQDGFWMSPREALGWVSGAIARTRLAFESEDTGIAPVDFIRALVALGTVHAVQGDNTRSDEAVREAIVLARRHGQTRLLARAITMQTLLHVFQPTEELIGEAEEAIRLSRKHDYALELAVGLSFMGGMYVLSGDVQEGSRYVAEGVEILTKIGNPRSVAIALEGQAVLAVLTGDFSTARELGPRAMEKFREIGSQTEFNRSHSRLAHVLRQSGLLEEARAYYRQTIVAWQEQGQLPAVAHQLECFAFLSIEDGDYEHAARLLGCASETRRQLDAASIDPREIAELEAALERLSDALGDDALERLMAEGARLDLDEGVALALAGVS